MYDATKARIAQSDYVNKHDYPFFAPWDGICFKCKAQIYNPNGITVEEASSKLVTGCPFCGVSFCE